MASPHLESETELKVPAVAAADVLETAEPAGVDAPAGSAVASAAAESVSAAWDFAVGPTEEPVSDKIITIPNIISFIRMLMIPVFLYLLLKGYNLGASILFAVAALTDCIDGYIARATHSVSRLGQILDPAVDRLLMISGAIGLILVGRLPLWIFLLVLFRDAVLLVGGAWLLRTWQVRVPVIYAGKVVTTLLFSGFAFLLINWPIVAGLGWTSLSWLPGFNALPCSVGIWLVYLGLVMGVFTTSYYVIKSVMGLREAKARAAATN